jgi:hypothetical protein
LVFSGKKRTITIANSDDEDDYVPRYILSSSSFKRTTNKRRFSSVHDSPKKVRINEAGPSTPSKTVKITDRQLAFDNAVYV